MALGSCTFVILTCITSVSALSGVASSSENSLLLAGSVYITDSYIKVPAIITLYCNHTTIIPSFLSKVKPGTIQTFSIYTDSQFDSISITGPTYDTTPFIISAGCGPITLFPSFNGQSLFFFGDSPPGILSRFITLNLRNKSLNPELSTTQYVHTIANESICDTPVYIDETLIGIVQCDNAIIDPDGTTVLSLFQLGVGIRIDSTGLTTHLYKQIEIEYSAVPIISIAAIYIVGIVWLSATKGAVNSQNAQSIWVLVGTVYTTAIMHFTLFIVSINIWSVISNPYYMKSVNSIDSLGMEATLVGQAVHVYGVIPAISSIVLLSVACGTEPVQSPAPYWVTRFYDTFYWPRKYRISVSVATTLVLFVATIYFYVAALHQTVTAATTAAALGAIATIGILFSGSIKHILVNTRAPPYDHITVLFIRMSFELILVWTTITLLPYNVNGSYAYSVHDNITIALTILSLFIAARDCSVILNTQILTVRIVSTLIAIYSIWFSTAYGLSVLMSTSVSMEDNAFIAISVPFTLSYTLFGYIYSSYQHQDYTLIPHGEITL